MIISTEPISKSPLERFDLINIAVLWRPHRRSVFKQWSDIDVLKARVIISGSRDTKHLLDRCLSNGASKCGYAIQKFGPIDHFSPFKVTQGHRM